MPRNRAPTGGFGFVHVRPYDLIGFDPSDYSVVEADATVTLTVVRTGKGIGSASVNYATADDSAVAGTDYVAASGTINWSHGEVGAKTFDVAILADAETEGDEDFFVRLTAPIGAQLGVSEATVVIIDAADDCPAAVNAIFGDGTAISVPILLALPAAGESATRTNVAFGVWDYAVGVDATNPCSFLTNIMSSDTVGP